MAGESSGRFDWLIAGLYLGRAVHLSLIVRKWPSRSKERSLVNRLRRFLDNAHVDVRRWYEPIAADLLHIRATYVPP